MRIRMFTAHAFCICVAVALGTDSSVTESSAQHHVRRKCSEGTGAKSVFEICDSSLLAAQDQEVEVVSLLQLHSLSKRNGTNVNVGEDQANSSNLSQRVPFGFIQSLHVTADEVGKAIATGDFQHWPWRSVWRTRWIEASGEAEYDAPLDYSPPGLDVVVPATIRLSNQPNSSFGPNHSARHHHHHSGRHHNPYQRSHVDLTMIDHWCIDDMFLLIAASLLLIAFDIALSMSVREHTMKSHLVILFLTVMFSIIYFLCVRIGHDWHYAEGWLTGYIVEIAMSIENMFAIHLIFMALKVPEEQVEFALTVGIYGALALRLVFIVILERLFTVGYVVDVVVGSVLILSGLLTLEDMDETGVDDLAVTRLSKWIFGKRLLGEYDKDGRVFVKGPDGERRFTLLFLVVWLVVFVDIMFAVDSVGSKTGHIRNTYLNLSSAVMAVFTLRASFFVIRDAAKTFHCLKYGICLVLLLMGAEMLASKWLAIGLGWICGGICIIFMMSIFMSLIISVDHEEQKQLVSKKEELNNAPPKKKSETTLPSGRWADSGQQASAPPALAANRVD